MSKRKAETLEPEERRKEAFNKEEMLIETVQLVIKYNLMNKIPSNDIELILFAKKLNVDELRTFNNKMKKFTTV